MVAVCKSIVSCVVMWYIRKPGMIWMVEIWLNVFSIQFCVISRYWFYISYYIKSILELYYYRKHNLQLEIPLKIRFRYSIGHAGYLVKQCSLKFCPNYKFMFCFWFKFKYKSSQILWKQLILLFSLTLSIFKRQKPTVVGTLVGVSQGYHIQDYRQHQTHVGYMNMMW